MSEKSYEKELAQFEDPWNDSPFMPFPSVEAVIEALQETAGWVIAGDMFLDDVYAALGALNEKRTKEWLESYGVTE